MSALHYTIAELQSFLVSAYQVAWPRNVSTVADGNRFSGFDEVNFTKEPWSYADLFYGSSNDAGIELVRYLDKPVWANVYRGGLAIDLASHDVFGFLTEALDASSDQTAFRPRGPATYASKDGRLIYRYTGYGDLTRFFGVETICCDDELVYERTVAGGLIGSSPVIPQPDLAARAIWLHTA
jgi:hypothetical protein